MIFVNPPGVPTDNFKKLEFFMIKRSLWILALTAALAACSSGVKLSEVPVEDKNASASAPASTDAAQSSVAPVVGKQ